MIRAFHQAFRARPLIRDDSGAALVELAIVLPLFLLLLFGLIDFGRLGFETVMAEKAMDRAARIAATRPAACPGVPNFNLRGTVPANTVPPRFGTSCSSGATICANPGAIVCTGVATNPTVAEIWTGIAPLMPHGATVSNLRFSYTFDRNLGFLGGPYVPVVTVELQNLSFQFVSPLGGLAALAGATGTSNLGAPRPFPSMSVSLPAEDLAQGNDG